VVVDREVDVLPAGAAAEVAYLVAEHALADRPEAAEPLDVDVDELPWPCPLIAPGRLTWRFWQARDAVTMQHFPDC
jgi:hypothetical protein